METQPVPAAEPPYSIFDDANFEIVESKTIGESTYVRAYHRGSDEETFWVHRGGESEELMSGAGDGSPHDAYRTMTGPNAPTALREQLVKEGGLWRDQARTDAEWEEKRERLEREDALQTLERDLADGEIAQAAYEEALVSPPEPPASGPTSVAQPPATGLTPSSRTGDANAPVDDSTDWMAEAAAALADMTAEQAARLRNRLGVLATALQVIRDQVAPDSLAKADLPPEQALTELTAAIAKVQDQAQWWLALPEWARIQSIQAAAVGAWSAVKDAVGQGTALATGDHRITRLLQAVAAAACRAVAHHAAHLASDLTARGYGGTRSWSALRSLSRRAATLAARVLGRPVDPATARRLAALDREVAAVARQERAARHTVLAEGARRVTEALQAWAGTPMGRQLVRSAHPRIAALRRAWQILPLPGTEPRPAARAHAQVAEATRALADAARASRRFRPADLAALDVATRVADEHTHLVASAAGLTPPPPAARHAAYAGRPGATGGSLLVTDACHAWAASGMGRRLRGSRHPRVTALRAAWKALPQADLPDGPAAGARAYRRVAETATGLADAARASGRFQVTDLAALDALVLAASVHAGRLAATAGIADAATPVPRVPQHAVAAQVGRHRQYGQRASF